jgi:hypothetical protein
MSYHQRREKECAKLFEEFHPDLSKSREPAVVLQVLELAAKGLFSHEIAQCIGKTSKAVQKIFRRYNFPTLYNFVPPLREERQGWKGGVKIVGGHAYSRCPGHPRASKYGNYVPVHRLVFEAHLGRFLEPQEVVHHKDNNPLNNDISNLELFVNNGEHLKATLTGKPHNVSESGRLNIRAAVIASNRRRAGEVRASHQGLETCD